MNKGFPHFRRRSKLKNRHLPGSGFSKNDSLQNGQWFMCIMYSVYSTDPDKVQNPIHQFLSSIIHPQEIGMNRLAVYSYLTRFAYGHAASDSQVLVWQVH